MWWIVLAALGAALYARSEYEKKHFSVEQTEIVSKKIHKRSTLVFLSDLHNNEFGPDNKRLLDAIDQVKPDAVLIGGDMMIAKGTAEVMIPLRLIKKLAEKYPVFCGNGNHENRMDRERYIYGSMYDEYKDELLRLGVVYLDNKSCDFGEDLRITGVDIEESFYRKFASRNMTPDYLLKKVKKADKNRYQILLLHSPMFFTACREWGADLTLSGHFHGGTIRIPFLGGLMTPQFQFFFSRCAGTFEEMGSHLIVSRGLGTHSVNIRLNDKPQVVVINLKPEETTESNC